MSTDNRSTHDVVVVGAGVIGLTIAWRAAQAGLDVCLVDAGAAGAGTSAVAAGMLAPVTEADFGERELIELNLAAARAYPEFVAAVEQASGLEVGYRRCGTLAIATDRDEREQLERLHGLQNELGLKAELLDARRARELEPALARRVTGGIHAPDDHQISPRALTRALRVAAERGGVALREHTSVEQVAVGDGVVLTAGESIGAEQIVVAAGSWTGSIAGLPEPAPPVRPVKGQILRLRGVGDAPLVSHVIRTPEVYAVPRADGRLVVGATVEEMGDDRTVTAGGVLELLRRVYDVLPGITELELVETSAGLRPTTPDNGPLVGPGTATGLFYATGHWRNGILLAAYTASAVVAMLTGAAPPPEFAPFGGVRFAREAAPR